MKKKTILYTFSSIGIILSIFAIYQIFFFTKNLFILNKTIYCSSLPNDNFKSTYTPKLTFEDMPVKEVKGLTLNILNKSNLTNVPMLLKSQRYYLSLDFICSNLGYNIDTSPNKILLVKDEDKISLTEDCYEKNSKPSSLRGDLITNNGTYYISISDIEQIFNLIAVFDFKNNQISLLDNNITKEESPSKLYNDRISLIRFEDFSCGGYNFEDINQTKIKCIANLMYSNGIKFHISWIPHFKSPEDNIDNDLLTTDNIINAGFVNLMDYLINKGAEIGLHGYTHQHDNEKSGIGEELSKEVNNTIAEAKTVIENGLDTASALNIPIYYFESPHYSKSDLQKKVIEDYFQYIYESFDGSKNNIYTPDNSHLFIPTPLGYVHNSDPSSILDGLKKHNPDELRSFYYHPFIELKHVKFNIKDNKLNVDYDENSPLQQIVKTLKSEDYTTVHVSELIDK